MLLLKNYLVHVAKDIERFFVEQINKLRGSGGNKTKEGDEPSTIIGLLIYALNFRKTNVEVCYVDDLDGLRIM